MKILISILMFVLSLFPIISSFLLFSQSGYKKQNSRFMVIFNLSLILTSLVLSYFAMLSWYSDVSVYQFSMLLVVIIASIIIFVGISKFSKTKKKWKYILLTAWTLFLIFFEVYLVMIDFKIL